MSEKNPKNAPAKPTEGGRPGASRLPKQGLREALGSGGGFWEGPPGWILVMLMLGVGIAAILYVYESFDDHPQGEVVVELKLPEPEDGRGRGAIISGMDLRALDGRPADDGAEYAAVMLDNIYLARPQAGVADSPLVIEAPVEGGITRLMVFLPADVDSRRIGPVRSARPCFVEWAEEYDAVLTHVGGSPQALDQIASSDLRSLNQMGSLGGYFWRDRGRNAPHNVYTSSDLLETARERLGERTTDPDITRPFKEGGFEGSSEDGEDETEIRIGYSVSAYRVTWAYDGELNRYRRYQGRGEFTDERGEPVLADNVIVQFTDTEVIDRVGRLDLRTVGTGRAVLFRDGLKIEAEWEKEPGGRTRFLDAETGEELPWNVGVTWVQVVDGDDHEVEF